MYAHVFLRLHFFFFAVFFFFFNVVVIVVFFATEYSILFEASSHKDKQSSIYGILLRCNVEIPRYVFTNTPGFMSCSR